MSQKERTRHFDQYQASADRALRDLEVVAQFGERLTSTLLSVNQSLFLPNMRNCRARIPKNHRGIPEEVAFLPLSDKEAAKADRIVAPLFEERYERTHRNESVTMLSGYALSIEDLVDRHVLARSNKLPRPTPAAGNFIARTYASGSALMASDGKNSEITEFISRPVEVVKMSGLQGLDEWGRAAVIVHEHTHAYDARESLAVFELPEGAAASELLAYSWSDFCFSRTDQPSSMRDAAHYMELLRQEHVDPEAPFTPAPALLGQMSTLGYLH